MKAFDYISIGCNATTFLKKSEDEKSETDFLQVNDYPFIESTVVQICDS